MAHWEYIARIGNFLHLFSENEISKIGKKGFYQGIYAPSGGQGGD